MPGQVPTPVTVVLVAATEVAAVATDDVIQVRRPPERNQARSRKSRAQWLFFAAMAAVGGALGYFGARYGMALFLPVSHKLYKLAALPALPLLWLVVVGFHELGHVVGGWLGGGRFLLWLVGPFKIWRSPAGVRFGWNSSLNLAGGLAACLPLDPAKMTPRRAALMILGGPVFSLVLVVAALWVAAWLGGAPGAVSDARAVAQHLVLFTAALSAMIFLFTAAPSTMGGFKSDGRRCFELLRGDAKSDQEAAMLALTTAGIAGVRPADYDPELVRRVLALDDGSLFDLYAHFTVYAHRADRGEWAAAQAHLDRVLAGSDSVMPAVADMARCEYAWLLATRTTDAAAARAWLDSAGMIEFDPATRLRAEAAVLLAEGRAAEAAAKAREGLHAVEHKALSPAKNQFAAEALGEILRRAEASTAA